MGVWWCHASCCQRRIYGTEELEVWIQVDDKGINADDGMALRHETMND